MVEFESIEKSADIDLSMEILSKDKKRVFLIIMIIVSFILAVILAITITINLTQKNINISEKDDITTQNIEQNNSIDEMIAEYQSKINSAKDNDEKVMLYNERANLIIKSNNQGKNHDEQALSDFIEMYNINKTVGNAVQIINYAWSIGKDDVAKQYEEILKSMENNDNEE